MNEPVLPPTRTEAREATALLLIGFAALALSSVSPRDRPTWFLEVLPAIIAATILLLSWQNFRLTPLAYRLIFLHALVLIVGGHYTYAQVPVGYWLQDLFHLWRNPYDRIGHFFQGFVPAIVAREILLRVTPLARGKMLFFLVCCVCLAISAFYELIEWWVARMFGAEATDFLGTQGDQWDTQWDMFLALIGAVLAQLILGSMHDRQLARLTQR